MLPKGLFWFLFFTRCVITTRVPGCTFGSSQFPNSLINMSSQSNLPYDATNCLIDSNIYETGITDCISKLRTISDVCYEYSTTNQMNLHIKILKFFKKSLNIIENSMLRMLSLSNISDDFLKSLIGPFSTEIVFLSSTPLRIENAQAPKKKCNECTASNCLAVVDSFCFFLTSFLKNFSISQQMNNPDSVNYQNPLSATFTTNAESLKARIAEEQQNFRQLAEKIDDVFKKKFKSVGPENSEHILTLKCVTPDGAPLTNSEQKIVLNCKAFRENGFQDTLKNPDILRVAAKDEISEMVFQKFIEPDLMNHFHSDICPFCSLHLLLPNSDIFNRRCCGV